MAIGRCTESNGNETADCGDTPKWPRRNGCLLINSFYPGSLRSLLTGRMITTKPPLGRAAWLVRE